MLRAKFALCNEHWHCVHCVRQATPIIKAHLDQLLLDCFEMASGRSLYQRYLQVITRWPLDPTKEGRDLSARIRARVGVLFPKGELTQVPNDQLTSVATEVEALERITTSVNQKRYSNASDGYTAASGLTVEHLHRATSTDFIEDLNYAHDLGRWNRIKYRIRGMFS